MVVSGVHISHLRSGRRDNPSARLLAALAELFGVPIGYFFDPTMENRINAELDALTALQDSRAKSLMLRAQGVSPESMDHLEGLLERIRQIEARGILKLRQPMRSVRLERLFVSETSETALPESATAKSV